MGKKLSPRYKGKFSVFIWPVIAFMLLSGCATTSTDQVASEKQKVPVIESLTVNSSPEQTVIEIINSRSAPYTAFRLVDPPRVILDIRGEPGADLPQTTEINDGNVKEIRFEKGKAQAITTRMVIGMARSLEYQAQATDHSITLIFSPKPLMSGTAQQKTPESSAVPEQRETSETQATPSEPRIFFQPKTSDLNQVLGVDYSMLDQGKSRVTVSTDKKVPYDLDRQGEKGLVLKLQGTAIPPLLIRDIDSSHFFGAVDLIKPTFSSAKKEVSFAISLREMVPYHVRQDDTGIIIDFAKTTIMPPGKKIVPLQMAQDQPPPSGQTPQAENSQGDRPSRMPGLQRGRYIGVPMTMDFVNADVTNILRLIGEMSNLNIVWGPEVTGTVSMRLKNVPWDQALDLILTNNKLAKRRVGNVIWITTKANMAQVEAEEKNKKDSFEAEVRREKEEAIKATEKAKKDEPLVTEYIGVDFATADEIKGHVVISERGTVSVDTRTNTIIITETKARIEEAKEIVKQFDTPVKQVMIEARIVDATDTFIRQLGFQWFDVEHQVKNTPGVAWSGTPGFAPNNAAADYPPGGSLYNPTFSTSLASDLSTNLGLVFTKLSTFGLTGTVLDMRLALAESENLIKTIAAPKVIASNGQAATISRGDTLVLAATENVESSTLDATLSLTVTPTVSYNNYVTMEIAVTDDDAPSVTQLTTKQVQTTMMVKSGETIVIGGIYTEDGTQNEAGIPVLKDIPLLGWLFKTRYKKQEKKELLIFLTPTVLPSGR